VATIEENENPVNLIFNEILEECKINLNEKL
jgi:hypothetical protein